MTNDSDTDEDEQTEREELDQSRELLEKHSTGDDAIADRLEELDTEREKEKELAEMKIQISEAEDAGLGDDPAIQRLREQTDALQEDLGIDTEPTPEEKRQQHREALEKRKAIADRHNLDDLAADIEEELDALAKTGEVEAFDNVDAYSADPAERAEAKISHLKQKLDEEGDEEALDAYQDAAFMMNFAAAGDSDGERRAAAKMMADLGAEHGIDLSEIRPGA